MKFSSKNGPENLDQRFFSQKSKNWYRMVWKSLLDDLVEGFQPQYNHKMPYKVQVTLELISSIIVVFQLISIFWYPVKTPQDWDTHSLIWEDLRVFNYDYICSAKGAYRFCYYGQVFVVLSSFFGIISSWMIKKAMKKVSNILMHYSKVMISIFTRVALIPSLKILLVIFKYSTFNFSEVQEYSDEGIEYYNYGLTGSILSLIVFGFLLMINLIYELITADIRHLSAKRNIRARSHSSMNVLWIIFCTIEIMIYLFLGYEKVIVYMIFTMITSAILLLKFLYYLPYYNRIENSICASKIVSAATGSLAFMLGYLYDDAYVIIFIFIFFTPFAIALIVFLIFKNYSKLQDTKNPTSNQYNFEKSIRHLLSDKKYKNKDEVIQMLSQFSNNTNFTKDGLFVIWETNYYIDVARDERLAMVKLSQIDKFQSNLEGWIQKYRISKRFHYNESTVLKEINYLQFLKKLNSAKKKDKELCYFLLDIYVEICYKNTRIPRLRYLVKALYDHSIETKKLYKFLIENYKHSESYKFYADFLAGILGHKDEGDILLKRRQSIKKDPNMDHEQLDEYSDNIGLVFLSADREQFGAISFINAKASWILKVSALEIIGKNFNDFIPSPYSLDHTEKMKNFFMLGTQTNVEKPLSLILQDNSGYIFECKISVKLTAFKDKAYFLVSFSPILSTRQVILVSEEGEIYSHSSLLTDYLGLPQESMANKPLNSLLNGFELPNMELFNPISVKLNNHDFKFVHITKKIKSTTIHLILVIKDAHEQLTWKNKNSDEQLKFYEKDIMNSPNFSKASSKILFKKESVFNENDASYKVKNKLKNAYKIAEENIESPTTFSHSSKNISEQISYKSNKKTAFLLHRFQWILLITVVALIATNIGILVYIVDNVSNSDLSAVFSTLGSIELSIGVLPILCQMINDELTLGKFNITRDIGILYWSNTKNILAKSELIEESSKWSSCPCSDILTDNIIPIWDFNSGQMLKKYNLYDVLNMFIDHTQQLIDDIKNREDYKNNIKWLMINGITFVLKYVHKVSLDLLKCEENSKSEKTMVINILFIIGILVCAIFITLLMAFAYFLKLVYEKFWLNLKKSVVMNSIVLKNHIFDRLSSVHNEETIAYDTHYNNNKTSSNYHIKTTLAKRLFYRLSFIIIISLCFYLFMIFFLYKDCQESMLDRSRLLQNFKFRSILVSKLALYIKEIHDNLFLKYYPEAYGFPNPNTEFYKIIDEYDAEYKKLLSSKWEYLLSKEIKTNLFESTNSTLPLMKFGLISATDSVINDSLYLSRVYSDQQFSLYYLTTMAFQSGLANSFSLAYLSSKEYIDDQLNSMVYLTILFSVILTVMSFLYYIPYLKREKKFVDKACFLLEIVTNSKEMKTNLYPKNNKLLI